MSSPSVISFREMPVSGQGRVVGFRERRCKMPLRTAAARLLLAGALVAVNACAEKIPAATTKEERGPKGIASISEVWPGRPLPPERIPRLRQLTGLGAMVDLGFPYYQNRTWRGLAKEMRARGFTWVAAFAHQITPEFEEAVHAEGLALVAHVWGTIIYGPESLAPPPPEGGRQVFAGGPQKAGISPVFYCSSSDAFIAWYGDFIRRTLDGRNIDLLVVGEAFLGSWNGPDGETYGCFCPNCLRRFNERYPEAEGFPEFKDETSPRYWKDNKALYSKWVDFRAETQARFARLAYGEMIRRYPDIPIAGYMLAVDEPDAIALVRERNGQDIDLLPAALPFDFFLFQAHWPDWIQPGLSAEHHARSYKPFLDHVRARHPKLRLGFTTDSGSHVGMRRSMGWINSAFVAGMEAGFDCFGIYEYCISRYIYEEPPTIIESTAHPSRPEIELVFSKRMDPNTVALPENYALKGTLRPSAVSFDGGNVATLTFKSLPRGTDAALRVRNVLDDRGTFWFNAKGEKPEAEGKYPANPVNPNADWLVRIPGDPDKAKGQNPNRQ